VSVAGINGFSGDVSLSLGGLTSGQARWTFTPPVVGGGTGSALLDVTTAAAAAPGIYPLTITATSGSAVRTSSVTLVIPAPPDFTLAASPTKQTIPAGASTTYAVSVGALNGFTDSVGLSLAGLPAGVGSAAFSPATVTTARTTQLSVTTLASARPGTYPLTITTSSGPTIHQATVTLVVSPHDFAVSASPSSVTVFRRQRAAYALSVTSVGGFSGSVALAVSGLPSGAAASFSSNPAAAPGGSQLTVSTTSFTTRGTFTLVINATSGARLCTRPR
jgi:hypothetical protein